jgi:hypothetical protein
MRLTVVGLANDEKRARPPGAMPAGPWLLWLAEAKLNANALHHCTVEAVRSFEVADAHKDMREHLASSLAGMPTDGIAVQVPFGSLSRDLALRRGDRVHLNFPQA